MAWRKLLHSGADESKSPMDLAQVVLESLPPTAASLSVVYIAATVVILLTMPRAEARVLTPAMAAMALVNIGVAIAAKRSAIPLRWAHATQAALTGLVLVTSLLYLGATGALEQMTYYFVLSIVGAGAFILSTFWFAVVAGATIASLGAMVLVHPSLAGVPPSAKALFGIALFSGMLLSILIHTQRIRTLRQLQRVRLRDQARKKELDEALQATQESEARLHILFEHAADAMFVTRLDGQVVRVNEQACRSLGYGKDEILRLNLIDIDAELENADDLDRIVANLASAHSATLERRNRRKDGSTFPVEVRVAYLETPQGPQLMGIARDVTERVRAERALQRHNRELGARNAVARALAASPDLNERLDEAVSSTVEALGFAAGLITLADETTGTLALANQTGLPAAVVELLEAEGLEGTLCSIIYGENKPLAIEDLRQGAPANVAALLRFGMQAYVGAPIIYKGRALGSLCLLDREPRALSKADKDLLAALGQQVGIAVENARLLDRDRRRRLYLDAVLTAAPDAIITIDADNQVVEWNPGAERLFGYSPDEAMGKLLDDLIAAPDVREEAAAFTRTTMEGEHVSPVESVRYRKDGSSVEVILAGSPIFIEGDFAGAVAVYTDISALKEAQQALAQHAADLAARNEELDAFSQTVAHDLKGPLQLLIGYSDLLAEEYATLTDQLREKAVRTIGRTADRMNNIIGELLLLAEVRRGELPSEPIDMAPIVAAALDRVVQLAEQRDAQIKAPETWPTALGYAAWVEEAWANYLSNAIKYGGEPPRVELGASEQPDGTVRFWVRDNGQGLTPEEQARLFVPFTRLHQVRAEGQGLGLSIVRRIMDKLGGDVGIESEVGEGSTFYFTLPKA